MTTHAAAFEETYLHLREHGLFVVSNRGPLNYRVNLDGSLAQFRSAGGVASAFLSLARYVPFTWVAAAMSAGDRDAAGGMKGFRLEVSPTSNPIAVHLVKFSKQRFHQFYDVIGNSLLWPLHHYLWDATHLEKPDRLLKAWREGYVPINRGFAQAVADAAGGAGSRPVVLVQDYHLFLMPKYLRLRLPGAVISHFLHIPWPGPRYWSMLPRDMRLAILDGLGHCDFVGLQTERDVHNLLEGWAFSDRAATVDKERGIVITSDERLVHVKAYPISSDPEDLREAIRSPTAMKYRQAIRRFRRKNLIVRIDRMDPTKNAARGFLAYERLLRDHPELHGHVQFVALLVPSRQGVRAYRRYGQVVRRIIERINKDFGHRGWQPVITREEENYERALALLQEYDVLVVNSLMDGMNLVAKEGALVNSRDGVIILSDTTGSHRELVDGVVSVSPADIDGLAEALYQAVTMPAEERARRAATLRATVERYSLNNWLESQLVDLESSLQERFNTPAARQA